jgi:murein DD-endopeptidase MepM/ murein hydrolase activator NlpD
VLRLVQPWPEPYTINKRSPFGWRQRHPITGKRTFHHGIDVAMPVGTRLTAPAPGTIVHKGNNGSGGVTLIIRHADNMHTVYYHLQRPSPLAINDKVNTGDFIAFSGNTGASTGPHLHFELRRSRKWGDTIDPASHIVKPLTQPEPAPVIPEPVKPEPVEIADILPEPVKPIQTKPTFNRPISADHMERIVKKFGNFGRRGWFGG